MLIIIVGAGFWGSLPSGVLVAKGLGLKDPRTTGSGNIGAANMTRSGGLKAGAITFSLDFMKGFIPVFFTLKYGNFPGDFPWILGGALVLSHCYSVFLGLRGGKGVATAAGVFFALTPLNAAIGLAVWIMVFFGSKITSLAAITAMFAILLSLAATSPNNIAIVVSLGIFFLIVRRHEENLYGLISGSERRFH